jgi:hypothetical protein
MITKKQNSWYWREWSKAHRADLTLDRHECHIAALGHDKSHTTFTNEEFDLVIAEFLSISEPDNLDMQIRLLREPKTRLIHKISEMAPPRLRHRTPPRPLAHRRPARSRRLGSPPTPQHPQIPLQRPPPPHQAARPARVGRGAHHCRLPVLSGNRYASHYTPIPPIPVKPTSRTFDLGALKSYAREWAGVPMAIAATADRLRAVTIDPPYPMSTRSAGGKGYVHEMSDQDHRKLAWMLHSCAAKVLISG